MVEIGQKVKNIHTGKEYLITKIEWVGSIQVVELDSEDRWEMGLFGEHFRKVG